MNIKVKCRNKINSIIKRSYWYNNVAFPDCKKFWTLNQFDIDVVNLGSSSGSHAFDYEDIELKCANWALSPKSLLFDYEVLRNYFSYLKKCATVIIPLCPFSCFVGYNCYVRDYLYTIIRHNTIPHFHINKRMEMMEKMNNPINHYPLMEFYRDIKLSINGLLGRREKDLSNDQLDKDADKWIDDWKYQFSIDNLDDEPNLVNRDAYDEATEILSKLIEFCLNRDLNPVIVIPPVTSHLYKRFTKRMIETNIENFVRRANKHHVPFLNYLSDERFVDKNELFKNSFFMNKKGAKMFTAIVIKDLGLE